MSGEHSRVEYQSESKGSLIIGAMTDWHLVSAYRKMTSTVGPLAKAEVPDSDLVVVVALEAEIRERELDPRWAGGKAPGHPLLNDKEPKRLEPHAHVDAVWGDDGE